MYSYAIVTLEKICSIPATIPTITPTTVNMAASKATAMAAATITTIAAATTTWGLMADVGRIDGSGVDGGGQQRGRQRG